MSDQEAEVQTTPRGQASFPRQLKQQSMCHVSTKNEGGRKERRGEARKGRATCLLLRATGRAGAVALRFTRDHRQRSCLFEGDENVVEVVDQENHPVEPRLLAGKAGGQGLPSVA